LREKRGPLRKRKARQEIKRITGTTPQEQDPKIRAAGRRFVTEDGIGTNRPRRDRLYVLAKAAA
jgi:hypothetical protein